MFVLVVLHDFCTMLPSFSSSLSLNTGLLEWMEFDILISLLCVEYSMKIDGYLNKCEWHVVICLWGFRAKAISPHLH
jgi:hypothetical protein